jgi:hypothetical protein
MLTDIKNDPTSRAGVMHETNEVETASAGVSTPLKRHDLSPKVGKIPARVTILPGTPESG